METFGTMPSGEPVHRLHIAGGGLRASVLTYGAVLQDLRLAGHDFPIVLGFPDFPPYLTHSPHFGATAGRCANRIRDGHVELDGQTFQLDRNFLGKHSLHGGASGTGKLLWQVTEHGEDSARLSITLPDGHMGFPGQLTADVGFSLLPSGVLDIRVSARCNAATLCNFVHHSYFCLDGGGSIGDHLLQIDAGHYLPVDDELIPTGEVRPVENSPFDFRRAVPLLRRSGGVPIDHNFCIASARGSLRRLAVLKSEMSGVEMQVMSTEPGLQVYDGERIDIDVPGLDNRRMGSRAGIALEPQIWPDANHHPHFPQAVLRPGKTYLQHTQYIFGKD